MLVAHWPELVAYGVMVLGVMVATGVLGVRFTHDTGYGFAQTRYLFPFMALYGAFASLAALGAGRRFARPMGALIVMLAMAHGLFGQLLLISRFYG